MAGWHVVENYLEQTGKHSTLVGKYWISTFLALRLLLLCSIVDDAFGDTDLECDTKTPGCERMCINHFYPLKPQSYWSIQMLFISLPIMIFMVYTSHKQEKIAIARQLKRAAINKEKEEIEKQFETKIKQLEEDRETLQKKRDVADQLYETPQGKRMTGAELERIFAEEENRLNELQKQAVENLTNQEKKEEDTEDNAMKSAGSDNSTPPKLFLGYVSMVFFRTVIEALFLAYYFQIYAWQMVMPETYQCDREPCNDVVTCYVERPHQKTIVIWIMFLTGCCTVFVGILELFSCGFGKIADAWSNRHDDITKEYKVGQMSNVKMALQYQAAIGGPVPSLQTS